MTPSHQMPGDPRHPYRLSTLARKVGDVLKMALDLAVTLSLTHKSSWSDESLDLEERLHLDSIPEDDIFARLRNLQRNFASAAADKESMDGLQQTPIDVSAHQYIASRLIDLLPGSLVVGEESSSAEWDQLTNAEIGAYIWQLDAIDGSGPQDTVGYGYSSNVLLYRLTARGAAPVMSVTVNSSAMMLAWITPNQVGVAYLNVSDPNTGQPLFVDLFDGPLAPLEMVNRERKRWVAVVAAQPKHRSLVQPLFAPGSQWTVMTLGGAPAMAGMLIDKLACLVIPAPQTRHDAAPLLALASNQNLTFIGLADGRLFSDVEVRGFFDGVVRPADHNPHYHPIPAMVIARDRQVGMELAAEIRASWADLITLELEEVSGSKPNLRLIDSDSTTTDTPPENADSDEIDAGGEEDPV